MKKKFSAVICFLLVFILVSSPVMAAQAPAVVGDRRPERTLENVMQEGRMLEELTLVEREVIYAMTLEEYWPIELYEFWGREWEVILEKEAAERDAEIELIWDESFSANWQEALYQFGFVYEDHMRGREPVLYDSIMKSVPEHYMLDINTAQRPDEITWDDMMALDAYIYANESGLLTLNASRALHNGAHPYLVRNLIDYLDFLNGMAVNNLITISEDLSITNNAVTMAPFNSGWGCGDWRCRGGTNRNPVFYRWYWRGSLCDHRTHNFSMSMSTGGIFGTGAGAVIAFLNPIIGAGIALGSLHAQLVASRATHNNHGRGVTLTMTYAAIFYYTPQRFMGDVNRDGQITSADVGLLQSYLAGWPVNICRIAADVNRDGQITAADIGLLRAYLAGFPIDF